jgi:hypothetical protein
LLSSLPIRREEAMRRRLPIAVSLCVFVVVLGAVLRMPLDGRSGLQAAEDAPGKKANLSLWVPEEELKVWDPVNVNVNPVPWRVYRLKGDDGQRPGKFRHTAVGKAVCVEGIAWGYDVETNLPKSRVIFEGGTVLVKGVDFNKPDVRGRCVRLTGTLRLGSMYSLGQHFERKLPNYYYIDARSFDIVDRVTEPSVILAP